MLAILVTIIKIYYRHYQKVRGTSLPRLSLLPNQYLIDGNFEFGEKYTMYWEQRNETDMQRTLRIQNQQTIKRLNQITNNEI
ncbi:hypothetical protein CLU79DRAFT_595101 [Phycomyces nitens]|nr:hypothetical protein CLU79DRAFT_61422 [Phycomyces nitens]KAI9005457.1 hypothetical protein CLU79DRAFT_595101 [Phycomyces nitens]